MAHGCSQDERRRAQNSQLFAHPGILAASIISTDVPKVNSTHTSLSAVRSSGWPRPSQQQATRTAPNQGRQQPCVDWSRRSKIKRADRLDGIAGSRASTRRDYERIVMGGGEWPKTRPRPAATQASQRARRAELEQDLVTPWMPCPAIERQETWISAACHRRRTTCRDQLIHHYEAFSFYLMQAHRRES